MIDFVMRYSNSKQLTGDAQEIGDGARSTGTADHKRSVHGLNPDKYKITGNNALLSKLRPLPEHPNKDIPAADRVRAVLRSTGQPLEAGLRHEAEQRFGYDLSNVVIHNDQRANRSALDINAKAYSVGNRIVFGSGIYQPESKHGRMILGHEIAHVIQQSRGGSAPPVPLFNSELEKNADLAARQFSGPRKTIEVHGISGVGVARIPRALSMDINSLRLLSTVELQREVAELHRFLEVNEQHERRGELLATLSLLQTELGRRRSTRGGDPGPSMELYGNYAGSSSKSLKTGIRYQLKSGIGKNPIAEFELQKGSHGSVRETGSLEEGQAHGAAMLPPQEEHIQGRVISADEVTEENLEVLLESKQPRGRTSQPAMRQTHEPNPLAGGSGPRPRKAQTKKGKRRRRARQPQPSARSTVEAPEGFRDQQARDRSLRRAKARGDGEDKIRALTRMHGGRVSLDPDSSEDVIVQEPEQLSHVQKIVRPGDLEIPQPTLPSAFMRGVGQGLQSNLSYSDYTDFARQVSLSGIVQSLFPVPFIAGTVVGLASEVWDTLQTVLGIVRNYDLIPEYIAAVQQILNVLQSRGGARFANAIGQDAGRHVASQVRVMNQQNPIVFQYTLGRLIGPIIVSAIVGMLLPSGAQIAFGFAAPRVIRFMRNFPPLHRSFRLLRRLYPHYRRMRERWSSRYQANEQIARLFDIDAGSPGSYRFPSYHGSPTVLEPDQDLGIGWARSSRVRITAPEASQRRSSNIIAHHGGNQPVRSADIDLGPQPVNHGRRVSDPDSIEQPTISDDGMVNQMVSQRGRMSIDMEDAQYLVRRLELGEDTGTLSQIIRANNQEEWEDLCFRYELDPNRPYFVNGDTILLRPNAELPDYIHEIIHAITERHNPNAEIELGSFLFEGTTDAIARSRVGPYSFTGGYDGHVEFVYDLSRFIGTEPFENAILRGNTRDLTRAIWNRFRNPLNGTEFIDRLTRLDRDNPDIEEILNLRSLMIRRMERDSDSVMSDNWDCFSLFGRERADLSIQSSQLLTSEALASQHIGTGSVGRRALAKNSFNSGTGGNRRETNLGETRETITSVQRIDRPENADDLFRNARRDDENVMVDQIRRRMEADETDEAVRETFRLSAERTLPEVVNDVRRRAPMPNTPSAGEVSESVREEMLREIQRIDSPLPSSARNYFRQYEDSIIASDDIDGLQDTLELIRNTRALHPDLDESIRLWDQVSRGSIQNRDQLVLDIDRLITRFCERTQIQRHDLVRGKHDNLVGEHTPILEGRVGHNRNYSGNIRLREHPSYMFIDQSLRNDPQAYLNEFIHELWLYYLGVPEGPRFSMLRNSSLLDILAADPTGRYFVDFIFRELARE